MTSKHHIIPRDNLDFALSDDIPRFWFGGDPFKTRFFDSMSTSFPEGERFFISCVRDYRDQVTDPVLLQEIKDFTRQEGQHGIVHRRFNDLLRKQGIDVDKLEGILRAMLFDFLRKRVPKAHTLASTAACEHLTAIMAQTFFERKEVLAVADPRMHAMYAWHAMEEMEHKTVAFDVMQKIAKVGYFRRIYTQLEVTLSFNVQILYFTAFMLKADGFSRLQRWKMMAKGMWWVYGPKGLFASTLRSYLRYFKPGFHPSQEAEVHSYRVWLDTYQRTGDPLVAGRAVYAAAF